MNIVLFGASGMLGQGVLRECLLAEDVARVQSVGRHACGLSHAKLDQVILDDLFDSDSLRPDLRGFDVCFFCLGVSSFGLDEAAYSRVTYDLTLSIARLLAEQNPGMVFVYVTGAGTDSSEQGRSMWARVKGKTENALLRLPFKAVYLFRPGVIQPLHGVRSKTPLYQSIYTVVGPLLSLLRHVRPAWVVSTETVGRAMLAAVRHGAPLPVVEQADINRLATERA